ncbi:hypothetical protein AOQ84DRAFT_226335 [Glonium stellatum]|uniref:Uncharacterized protein n=1 Tax=Glonium stellatum TaxID=574774 RepID=A0A8E2ESM1_9PEZI|nr:hypothetical protein AOQ84DRAFT_226335 [Glonium stellatum]
MYTQIAHPAFPGSERIFRSWWVLVGVGAVGAAALKPKRLDSVLPRSIRPSLAATAARKWLETLITHLHNPPPTSTNLHRF